MKTRKSKHKKYCFPNPCLCKKHCFTLIELLIVIAIIGILASTIVVSSYSAVNKAKYAKVIAELNHFKVVVQMAQVAKDLPLGNITNSWASESACYGIDLQNAAENGACAAAWQTALGKIAVANGVPVGTYSDLKADPWGAPYLLDENEMEPSGALLRGCTVHDLIFSVGQDGILSGDDVMVKIPFSKCPEADATDCYSCTP